MTRKPIRHGDVYLVPVDHLPDGRRVERKAGGSIQDGEVTGHAHRVQADHVLVTTGEAEELRAWMLLDSPADLVHEEHATITVPAGAWEIRRAREYAPDRSRWVAD